MIIRSKAPLRLGLAGGGTDVSPYADLHGGSILNATINMYAHTTIIPTDNGKIYLEAQDMEEFETLDSTEYLDPTGALALLKGVYNRVVKQFVKKPLSFEIYTRVDAPPGSGLGSSSTLVVSILGAFAEWQNIPLGEYDIAHLAYEIERIDLGLAGGRQDQYAATFGGFNFMEFSKDDKVIVNPLRIKQRYAAELEHNLVLFYMGTSRESAKIIEKQTQNINNSNASAIEATHNLKVQSVRMKEAILMGKTNAIGEVMHSGWESKKKMAEGISNPEIDKIYATAMQNGATGGKISGAGGGGYFFFYCPNVSRTKLIKSLEPFGVRAQQYHFTREGLYTYIVTE
jgi:D-glycero-alpha-D-manno-heptose-7-phosphate kinase|tara:strand:- start:2599 stop:3627 length:1029 start_codon:yes stop_codon:yes gene_type:complete